MKISYAILIICSIAIVLFAYFLHPLEEIENAERDEYVWKVEQRNW